jgi:hypothetical protein
MSNRFQSWIQNKFPPLDLGLVYENISKLSQFLILSALLLKISKA